VVCREFRFSHTCFYRVRDKDEAKYLPDGNGIFHELPLTTFPDATVAQQQHDFVPPTFEGKEASKQQLRSDKI